MSGATPRVAVVGAGLMGPGIAQVFAVAGGEVRVYDADPQALASLGERVGANLAQAGAPVDAAERIKTGESLEDTVAAAELVIEAVSENLGVKQAVFAELDRVARPDAVLASNTSAISISSIAESAGRPDRVVGTHWWNPPQLIPLVEVVPGNATAPATVARTVAMLEAVGKTPVRVKRDVPGFVGNRMQHALWREAIAIVEAGIAEPEDVDTVVKSSFGLRLAVLGPIEGADLVGLDLTKAIHDYLLPHLDARVEAGELVNRRVAEGDLGMKTGRGLRTWTAASAEAVHARLAEHLRRAVTRDR